MSIGRVDGSFLKQLLILDDWGLSDLDSQRYNDLLDVLDDRGSKRPTLVTSLLPSRLWHDKLAILW